MYKPMHILPRAWSCRIVELESSFCFIWINKMVANITERKRAGSGEEQTREESHRLSSFAVKLKNPMPDLRENRSIAKFSFRCNAAGESRIFLYRWFKYGMQLSDRWLQLKITAIV
jgi:hypothetical protein